MGARRRLRLAAPGGRRGPALPLGGRGPAQVHPHARRRRDWARQVPRPQPPGPARAAPGRPAADLLVLGPALARGPAGAGGHGRAQGGPLGAAAGQHRRWTGPPGAAQLSGDGVPQGPVDARGVSDGGPVIVVHGGAGDLDSADDRRQYLQGVGAALDAGLAALPQGATAAVLAAVVHMERHTIMNAGRGSALAEDGTAALDAGFMDGATRRYGGVSGVRRCMTPVLLAERLAREGDYGRLVAPPSADTLAA
ncbi:MAG: hypothetical protein FJ296_11600, partial [Planctomycetes bacterium]|nr:hypothetical protein [Planctomycetota bacterium]